MTNVHFGEIREIRHIHLQYFVNLPHSNSDSFRVRHFPIEMRLSYNNLTELIPIIILILPVRTSVQTDSRFVRSLGCYTAVLG